jgi:hypothetical protein
VEPIEEKKEAASEEGEPISSMVNQEMVTQIMAMGYS